MNDALMREHARREFAGGMTNADQFVKYIRYIGACAEDEKVRTAWAMRDADTGIQK